jgi:bacillithiol biosynthesis deacetylase BshB1
MKLDYLAFGAHPDDVELSCSGLLILEKSLGKKTGIIDLTEGELGSRGTVAKRYQEAADAAAIMKLDIRENLQLPDGFFKNDEATQLKVIQKIRKYKPEIVICNAVEDRHPDHGRGSQLVEDSAFLSGLLKIETFDNGEKQEQWRPKYVFHCIQDRYLEPSFLIDISSIFDKKLASILAYKTQFYNAEIAGPETYISKPGFLDLIINRDKMHGTKIGVEYAEGFISKKKLGFSNLDNLIKQNT